MVLFAFLLALHRPREKGGQEVYWCTSHGAEGVGDVLFNFSCRGGSGFLGTV